MGFVDSPRFPIRVFSPSLSSGIRYGLRPRTLIRVRPFRWYKACEKVLRGSPSATLRGPGSPTKFPKFPPSYGRVFRAPTWCPIRSSGCFRFLCNVYPSRAQGGGISVEGMAVPEVRYDPCSSRIFSTSPSSSIQGASVARTYRPTRVSLVRPTLHCKLC